VVLLAASFYLLKQDVVRAARSADERRQGQRVGESRDRAATAQVAARTDDTGEEDAAMPAPVINVTGASRGIGRAIVEELQSRGATVVGVARDVAEIPATATLLPVAGDVTEEAGRKAILEAAVARYGRIDALVNNAGSALRGAAVETSLDDFRQMLEANLLSTFALCRAVYPHLKASGGTVVNISSVTGSRVLPVRVAYGTSKAALDHLTRSLAVEWGPDGIRVNAVLPWFTRTEMVQKVLEDAAFAQRLIAATPLRRLAEPADVARATAFLALTDSNYITGQLLAVDGGYLAQGLSI
jgi:tropinone reductase I